MKLDDLLPQITPLPYVLDDGRITQMDMIDRLSEDLENPARHWTAIGISDREGFAESLAYAHPSNARYLAHAANHFPAALELIERALLALHEDDFPTLREDLRQFRARATNLPD
jgi:hypothetical protein